jgi:hypothetical protein
MGAIVITKWQCDRCGDIMKNWNRSPTTLKGGFIQVATDNTPLFEWKQICSTCYTEIRPSVDAMVTAAAAARAARGKTPN